MAKKRIHVLSNTHWDREHRHSFQKTRAMLVDCIDKLIEIMEADPEFKYYTMDGQSILIDDYLEVKPQMRDRLKKLISDGRILVGPWYSLIDCFAVQPECIVRNLLKGDRLCRQFGEPMKFGYSIFSFGQIAQLPQVYSGFDIDTIIFYKGWSPEVFEKAEFIWKSPDGSKALASRLIEYHRVNFFVYFTVPVILGGDMLLPGWNASFDNGTKVSHLTDELFCNEHAVELEPDIHIREGQIPRAIKRLIDSASESVCPNVILGFDGIDFSAPLAQIPEAIKRANEILGHGVELVHSNAMEYFDEFRKEVNLDSLMEYHGEMRYGPVWKLHSETMSANIPLKQYLHETEIKLIQYAETFSALNGMLARQYPKDLLNYSWKLLFQSQTHDTIHGTGVPQIVRDTRNRLEQVCEIAESLSNRALQAIVSQIDTTQIDDDDILVTFFNPAAHDRSEIVNLQIDIPRCENVKEYWLEELSGERLDIYQWDREDVNIAVVNPENRPKSVFCDRVKISAYVGDIPAFGYRTVRVKRIKGDPNQAKMPFAPPAFPFGPIGQSPNVLDNGLIKVEAAANGSLSLQDIETGYKTSGLNVFSDSGDSGDMWVHRVPNNNEIINSSGCAARISFLENSALKATMRIKITLDIPKSLSMDRKSRSDSLVPTTLITDVTVNKDSKRVDFKTKFNNACKDHKLTVLFPTGIAAEESFSLNPFEVRKRDIDNATNVNGRRGNELMRSVMQGFVDISDSVQGLALFSKGLKEFETRRKDQVEMELTLLRAVTQTFPAHEDVFMSYEKEESQCIGEHIFEYSLFPHSGNYEQGQVIFESSRYRLPVVAAQYGKGSVGHLPFELSFIKINNPQTIVSCVKFAEDDDRLIIRLNNPTQENINEVLEFYRPIEKAELLNLNEQTIRDLNPEKNLLSVDLPAYKIVTLALTF